MITVVTRHQLARVFQHLRVGRGLTRRDLAARLYVSAKTVANRERCELGMTTEVLIDTAHVLGFAVALVPQRHPGARPTGTGWPA